MDDYTLSDVTLEIIAQQSQLDSLLWMKYILEHKANQCSPEVITRTAEVIGQIEDGVIAEASSEGEVLH